MHADSKDSAAHLTPHGAEALRLKTLAGQAAMRALGHPDGSDLQRAALAEWVRIDAELEAHLRRGAGPLRRSA